MASNGFFVFANMGKAPLSRALREIKQSLFLCYIKEIDSMLPCICPVIDHRGRQNVVRTSVTHSAIASCATFLFLPHFNVICDLLLDRCTATWNLFVKHMTVIHTMYGDSGSSRLGRKFYISFYFGLVSVSFHFYLDFSRPILLSLLFL